MKKILLLIVLFVTIQGFGQKKNDSLVTSIGWVLHKGDTLQLGIGSMDNGNFAFVQVAQATKMVGGNPQLPVFNAKKNV